MTCALLRPVEIVDANADCVITWGGGAPEPVALDRGMHGSILAVMTSLEAAMNALHAGMVDIYLSAANKVVIENLDLALTVDWSGDGATDDTALRDMLGFTANLTIGPGSTATAPRTPQYSWFPTYETSDVGTWKRKPSFAGGRSIDGTIAGVSLSPDRYERTLEWPAEYSYNALVSQGTATYQQDRCFEQFIVDVLNAAPQESTADGLNPKGIYYVHDISVYQGSTPTVALPTTAWGSGGIDFELSSSPDLYVYTSPSPDGLPNITPLIDTMRDYQNLSLSLTTATAPSWNLPT